MILRCVAPALVLTACVTVRPPSFLQEPADRQLGPTLSRAQSLAANGQTAQADSLLAQFSATYHGSSQAREADYWRALIDLRSPQGTSRLADAIPLLRSYTAAGQSTEHWMEADALLRAAARLDSLNQATATYISKGEVANDVVATATARAADAKAEVKTATADTKAQDDEIKRLRDELAKTTEELDRIKKRLAEPPKKPPTRS
jgi:D-alanyl-D-alanine carboxypeptidase